MADRLGEMEREVLQMMQEREKELRDVSVRERQETRHREEEKGKMLEDIQNLIKVFKEEKKAGQRHQQQMPAIHSFNSGNHYNY